MRIKKSNFLNFSKIIIHIHTCYDKSELHIVFTGHKTRKICFYRMSLRQFFVEITFRRFGASVWLRAFVPRVTMIN